MKSFVILDPYLSHEKLIILPFNAEPFTTPFTKFPLLISNFDPSITLKNLSRALFKAQMLEYEWLTNKMEYYQNQANQDETRLKMIQSRINQSASEL